MLRISLQTLRAHRGTSRARSSPSGSRSRSPTRTGLLMAGALSAPGPGRFAAADASSAPTRRSDRGRRVGGRRPGAALDAGARAALRGRRRRHLLPGRRLRRRRPPVGDGLQRPRLVERRADALPPDLGPRAAGPREVVADARLARRHAPARRDAGRARRPTASPAPSTARPARRRCSSPTRVAARLSGRPGKVNAIAIAERARGRASRAATAPPRLGATAATLVGEPRLEVLDRDARGRRRRGRPARRRPRRARRDLRRRWAGSAGAVALFVVAGTFTLAIVQRRREVAVLRALGAAPHQVRRLIAGEALIVSARRRRARPARRPPARRRDRRVLADHGIVPAGFAPGDSWIPLVAAFGGGILIAQVAVFAAARRAGRTRPAEALREAAIERPGRAPATRSPACSCLGGGVAMALIFKGTWAVAFAILEGLLLAIGVGLLGRALLGLPAAIARPPAARLGASGLLAAPASPPTAGARRRWRRRSCSWRCSRAPRASSSPAASATPRRVTAERVTAPYVVTGRDGAPSRRRPRRSHAGVDGVAAVAHDRDLPGRHARRERAVAGGRRRHPRHARRSTCGFTAGACGRSGDLAVSRVFAESGDLQVGDTFTAPPADTPAARSASPRSTSAPPASATSSSPTPPRRSTAIFVAGSRAATATLAATASSPHPRRVPRGVRARDQRAGLGGLDDHRPRALFTALALINTAAMATAERRAELATIRLLGGTRGPPLRTLASRRCRPSSSPSARARRSSPTAVHGVPHGLTGIPLSIPGTLVAARHRRRGRPRPPRRARRTRLALRASPEERHADSLVRDLGAEGGARAEGESIVRRPSRASTRSARPRRPEPPRGSAPPAPSSDTTMRRAAVARSMRDADDALRRVLGDVGERLGDDVVGGGLDRPGQALLEPRPSSSTGIGARSASARTAGSSPRSVSTAGWMPRASSRSSCSACASSSPASSSRRRPDAAGRRAAASAPATPAAAARRRAGCAPAAAAPRPRPRRCGRARPPAPRAPGRWPAPARRARRSRRSAARRPSGTARVQGPRRSPRPTATRRGRSARPPTARTP